MANFNIDYLVVAGGGGGGSYGGGGAGGLLTSFPSGSLSLAFSTAYSITVGAKGAGSGNNYNGYGAQGSDSSISGTGITTITAAGGGYGGNNTGSGAGAASAGGSGGGGSDGPTNSSGGAGNTPSTTPSQGNNGGSGTYSDPNYMGGGGGGAGAAGSNATSLAAGNGGTGLEVNIIGGSGNYYAGGGGGVRYNVSGSWGSGGTGGGGNGGSWNATTSSISNNTAGGTNTGSGGGAGKEGGDGIVILRYATADANYTATGLTPTETTDGTDTILSFTTVGTGTITFSTPPPPPFSGTKVTTPVTDFNKPLTEEGLKIPSGTSSNQPTGIEGMVRNDTTQSSKGSSSAITYYNGTNWRYFENQLNTNFNTVTYPGNNSSNSITGVGFQPDLVWVKNRTNANSHNLFDSVRGATKVIYSNLVNDEDTRSNSLTSFDSDGFSLGNYVGVNGNYNYVAWCFKAGGAAVLNEEGSIDSQVSVNNELGFSIVKWSGDGSSATVGHGLDTPPELTIKKNLDYDADWAVNTYDRGGHYMYLNKTNAELSSSQSVNSTTFTASGNVYNRNGTDLIAYCFASKPNYSKVGSYVGNGNATGPVVTLGFEPAWLMFKCSTQSGNWIIIDNKRATSNPRTPHLRANSSAQDDFGANEYVDFTSTGFQPKGVSNYNNNASNQTYIYLAFANTI